MIRTIDNKWSHRFAMLTAATTLLLVCLGGVVTSKEVGLSVPDWPTTYGQNMFFFPISKWVGGIFYEHTHRLVASAVGLLTVFLAVWLWLNESRRWLRWLGIVAVFAVVLQGVLGGLRVTQLKDELGIFHAALAQLFFVLVSAIALFSSRWWLRTSPSLMAGSRALNCWYWLVTGMIFLQLVLGATMRHQHAGLAISDFPLAHHRIWPAMDPASVAFYNQERMEATAVNPITAFQVGLQMVHRIMAVLIFAVILCTAWFTSRRLGRKSTLSKLSLVWVGLIFSQAILGAATIWTGKSVDITTAHVAVGALSLMTGAMMLLAARRSLTEVFTTAPAKLSSEAPRIVPARLEGDGQGQGAPA